MTGAGQHPAPGRVRDVRHPGSGALDTGVHNREVLLKSGLGPPRMALVLVPGLGPMELVLIVFALLLIFGAKRIPLIARGLGEGIRDFKKSLAGADEKDDEPSRLESGTREDD